MKLNKTEMNLTHRIELSELQNNLVEITREPKRSAWVYFLETNAKKLEKLPEFPTWLYIMNFSLRKAEEGGVWTYKISYGNYTTDFSGKKQSRRQSLFSATSRSTRAF